MNAVLYTASAVGMGYKLTNMAGSVAGKAISVAADKLIGRDAVSNFFESRRGHDTNREGSEYELMPEDEFIKCLKTENAQHILMEMDVEARIYTAKSLLQSIKKKFKDAESGKNGVKRKPSEYLKTNIKNLEEISTDVISTLHKEIYAKIDEYNKAYLWTFISSLNVKIEMMKLRREMIVFEQRREQLIEALKLERVISDTNDTSPENSFDDEPDNIHIELDPEVTDGVIS